MKKRRNLNEPPRQGNSLTVLAVLILVATAALVYNTTYVPVRAQDACAEAPRAVRHQQAPPLSQQVRREARSSVPDSQDSQQQWQQQEQQQGSAQPPGAPTFSSTRSSWALGAPWSPPKYSTHTCISRKFDDNWRGSTCKFDNVCLNGTTNQFEYYLDPDYPGNPVAYDQAGKPYYSFPQNWVNPGHIMEGRDTSWHPIVKRRKFPQGDMVKWARWDQALLTTMPERFTYNFGHIMFDALVPLFNMQHLFGIYSRDAQIIMLDVQGRNTSHAHLRWKMRKRMHHPNPDMSLLRLHWDHYATWVYEVVKEEFQGSTDGLLCFKTALVGTGMLSRRMARIDSLPYRQAAFEYLGIKDEPQNVPLITLLNKKGRRMIENVDEIVAKLTDRYPAAKINVIDFQTDPDLTLAQQLKLMSETSILISPCGGLATVLAFMQPGATAIVMNFWNTLWNRSMNMEGQFYKNIEYLDIQYFPVLPEEYDGTGDRPKCEIQEGHRRYAAMGSLLNCNLRIKPGAGLKRLLHYVDNALLRWAARTGHFEALESLRKRRGPSGEPETAGKEAVLDDDGSGPGPMALEVDGNDLSREDDFRDDYLERRRL